MSISVRQQTGELAVAIINGRIDSAAALDIENGLNDIIAGGKTKVVVDLSGAEYISSGGLRALLGAAKELKAKGGDLRLCAMTAGVLKIFKMAGFTQVFQIYDTETGAIKSFS
ncbi:MAG: STAS domain-containing protein [Candidatus Magnetominusculus sp. LBB02]|nr:STAS domain-containing protein [Candidatus Magnetominusculus sp. LBB02]